MPEKYHPSDSSRVPSYKYEAPSWVDEMPASTPQWPDAQQFNVLPSSPEQKEINAAHHALDALGVPALADINISSEGEPETRLVTHDLRLHGRIEFLSQRLGELGVPKPFEEIQTQQDN